MLQMNKKAPVLLGLAVTLGLGLVGCGANNTSTSIDPIVAIDFEPVDKTIEADTWTVSNYKDIALLGYSSLVDNFSVRAALLGKERFLGVSLNLFSVTDFAACNIGNILVSQEDTSVIADYNACQNGETLIDGEVWTDLTTTCDDSTVTETFIMGYKDYRQRQKLSGSESYSQMYANGEYQFETISQLDVANIADNNPCPTGDGISSTVVLLPETFIQIEDDESETTIDNASFAFQPGLNYVEYVNLELTEDDPEASIFDITGTVNMNSLGLDITIIGTDFKYGLDGKTTEGSLELIKGNEKITLVFSSDTVIISLDLDTTVPGDDSSDSVAQENF